MLACRHATRDLDGYFRIDTSGMDWQRQLYSDCDALAKLCKPKRRTRNPTGIFGIDFFNFSVNFIFNSQPAGIIHSLRVSVLVAELSSTVLVSSSVTSTMLVES